MTSRGNAVSGSGLGDFRLQRGCSRDVCLSLGRQPLAQLGYPAAIKRPWDLRLQVQSGVVVCDGLVIVVLPQINEPPAVEKVRSVGFHPEGGVAVTQRLLQVPAGER